jgi:hypothetical protein
VIISNSSYPGFSSDDSPEHGQLPVARNDMIALKAALWDLVPADRRDSRVIVVEDVCRYPSATSNDAATVLRGVAEGLQQEIADWRDSQAGQLWRVPDRRDEVMLLVHYSGHGVDDGVEQYIQASDFSDDVTDAVIPLSEVLTILCRGADLTPDDSVVVTMDTCRTRWTTDRRAVAPVPFVKDALYVVLSLASCCRWMFECWWLTNGCVPRAKTLVTLACCMLRCHRCQTRCLCRVCNRDGHCRGRRSRARSVSDGDAANDADVPDFGLEPAPPAVASRHGRQAAARQVHERVDVPQHGARS